MKKTIVKSNNDLLKKFKDQSHFWLKTNIDSKIHETYMFENSSNIYSLFNGLAGVGLTYLSINTLNEKKWEELLYI